MNKNNKNGFNSENSSNYNMQNNLYDKNKETSTKNINDIMDTDSFDNNYSKQKQPDYNISALDYRSDNDVKKQIEKEIFPYSEAIKKELRIIIDEFKRENEDNKSIKDDIFKLQLQIEDNKRLMLIFQKEQENKSHNHELILKQLGKSLDDNRININSLDGKVSTIKLNSSDSKASKFDEKVRLRIAENTKKCEDLLLALKSVEKKLIAIKTTDIVELHNYCKKLKESQKTAAEEADIKNEIIFSIGQKINEIDKKVNIIEEGNKYQAEKNQIITLKIEDLLTSNNQFDNRLNEVEFCNKDISDEIFNLKKDIVQTNNLIQKVEAEKKELDQKIISINSSLNKDNLSIKIDELNSKILSITAINQSANEEKTNFNNIDELKSQIEKLHEEINNNKKYIQEYSDKLNLFVITNKESELKQNEEISLLKTEAFNKLPEYINTQHSTINQDEFNYLKDRLNITSKDIQELIIKINKNENELTEINHTSKNNTDAINFRLSTVEETISTTTHKLSNQYNNLMLEASKNDKANQISNIKTEIAEIKRKLDEKNNNNNENQQLSSKIDSLSNKLNQLETDFTEAKDSLTQSNLNQLSLINNATLDIKQVDEVVTELKNKSKEQITDILQRLNQVVEHFDQTNQNQNKEIEEIYSLIQQMKTNPIVSRNIPEAKLEHQASNLKSGLDDIIQFNTGSIPMSYENPSMEIETTQAEGNVRCFQSGYVSSLNPLFIVKSLKQDQIKESFINRKTQTKDMTKIEIDSVLKSNKNDINLNYLKSNLPTRSIYMTRDTNDERETNRITNRGGFFSEKFRKNQLYLSTNPINIINIKDQLPEYLNKLFIFEKDFENVLEVEVDMNEEDHLSVISVEAMISIGNQSMKKGDYQIHNPYFTPSSNDDLINLGFGPNTKNDKNKKSNKNTQNLKEINEQQASYQEDSFILQSIDEINEYQSGETNQIKNANNENHIKNISQLSDNIEVDINTDHIEEGVGEEVVNDDMQMMESEDEY